MQIFGARETFENICAAYILETVHLLGFSDE